MGRDDHNLAILLEKFMEKDFSHSMIQVDGDPRYRLNQKVLTPFLDPGSILDRTRTLTEERMAGRTAERCPPPIHQHSNQDLTDTVAVKGAEVDRRFVFRRSGQRLKPRGLAGLALKGAARA